MSHIKDFISSGLNVAITIMREAGISDTLIAIVVTEIRSRAISEESVRLQELQRQNPPTHFPWPEMQDAIKNMLPWEPRS